MGTQKTSGFTIIESLLFLAISGALIVAMIGGVGATIQIQRYRDAVETFKALVQDQYSELTSVKNEDRGGSQWSCNSQAETEETPLNARIRGQSECMLLGRYMTVQGSAISLRSVVGYKSGTSTTGNDIEKLIANYTINTTDITNEDTELEWGAQIAWPRDGAGARSPQTPRAISLLFIRSPDSGQVYTFSSDVVPQTPTASTLREMLVGGAVIPGQGDRTICIDSGGALARGDLSIYIDQFASGPTAVEVRSNDFIADPSSSSRIKTTQC